MVFIGGARQVGKTSLALDIAQNYFNSYEYLNWDYRDDRKTLLGSTFKGDADIILFDEIHKYKDWKNYLKGQFDKHLKDIPGKKAKRDVAKGTPLSWDIVE